MGIWECMDMGHRNRRICGYVDMGTQGVIMIEQ
jgi:hypothetical protein